MPGPNSFPRSIDGYDFLVELGRGTSGVVYKARNIALRRADVLKMPTDGPTGRALREARILAYLTGNYEPNVVALYAVGESNGQVYFAREFVDGADLASRLRARSIELSEVVGVLAVVSRAVHRIHQEQVVHLNLEASNVLLAKDGTPKLIGFGRARLNETGPAVPPRSVAIDIHALGRMIADAANELGEPLPEVLEAISMKCEAAGTDWGYTTAGEVAFALERYHRGE
ncbi:MAG TPA: protein kinase [Gemmataceae bacterium]|nr:protein kinase [Gemmataceae bacterium]